MGCNVFVINIGGRIVNDYILRTEIGYLAIDTGYAGNFEIYRKRLVKNSIPLHDIKFILLTHAHDDHAGFLNELIAETNATLVVDYLSPDRLLAGHNPQIGGCSGNMAKLFISVMGMMGKAEHKFPPVNLPTNAIIWDRNTQPLRQRGIPIDIVLLYGHTADSIGFLTEDGQLFCGDAAMNGFPSIHRKIIWIENLQDYKRSWNTMIGCKAKMIYPAHGKPFPSSDLDKFKHNLDKMMLR